MALETVPTPEPVDLEPVTDGEGSLAEHEAQFKPQPQAAPKAGPEDDDDTDDAVADTRPRDDSGRFKAEPRHRSQSQKAKPEDVAEINALTRTLREKEAELAKVKPDALAGSPRVLTLKQRIRAIEADLAELNATSKVEPKAKAEAATAPATFDEKEPTLDDFSDPAKYPDPYLALTRALAVYDRKKEAFEASQREAVDAEEAGRKAEIASYHARTATFAKTHEDFDAVTGPMIASGLPSLLVAALVKADKGPEYVYYLAQHQDALDELVLLTEGKPVTDSHVAIVQRRLKQQAQAAQSTGSATAATTAYIPPRPPNPVRTGPIRTGDVLPDDDSSLAEHEKAFGRKRR